MKALEKQELESLLLGWQSGRLSPEEVHEEAERLMAGSEWRDVPRTDPDSVMYEILCQLDILNQQLIVSDDVPAMLKFLRSAPDELELAWNDWGQYWGAIDYTQRKKMLHGSPFYAV